MIIKWLKYFTSLYDRYYKMIIGILNVLLVCSILGAVSGDFDCLCSMNSHQTIYFSPSNDAEILGSIYKTCKAIAGNITDTWVPVFHIHQVGFCKLKAGQTKDLCQGTSPEIDRLSTLAATQSAVSSQHITTTKVPNATPPPTAPTTRSVTPTSSQTTPESTNSLTPSNSTSPYVTIAALESSTSPINKTSTTQPSPLRQTTETNTTSRLTTQNPTETNASVVQLGNVGLCPSSVIQYANQDNEILTQIRHSCCHSCYTVVPHKYSWSHAEAECNRRGGHLFHVNDRLENLAIYIMLHTHFNHSVWMGLSDLNNEEHFEWTSNIPLNFTNWMPGRKTIGHDVEDCVVFVPYVDHGKWNDVQCGGRNPVSEFFYEKHYFICQFPTRNAPTAAPTISSQFIKGSYHDCPPNVISSVRSEGGSLERYGISCYERVSQRWTWNAAEGDCEYKGGHLVQMGSPQEEVAISQFLSHIDSQHAVWIGLHDQGHEETFTWTSGERLIYSNWLPGRKSNINHSIEDCVVLLPYKQGMWDDVPCGRYYITHGHGYVEYHTEAHPYICEYHITPGGPSLIGR